MKEKKKMGKRDEKKEKSKVIAFSTNKIKSMGSIIALFHSHENCLIYLVSIWN